MTVCIGAVCADLQGVASKFVVTGSDRMVTWNVQEFEHEVPKVTAINPRTVGLIAGDALRGSSLTRDLTANFHSGVQGVEQVVKHAADRYADMRREQIETEVFRPRGLTMQQFYSGVQPQLLPQLVFNIDNHVGSYDYNLQLLVAGVDDAGGHVFAIINPGGSFADSLPIGFTAIGSGASHAIQSMIGWSHSPARSLYETIFAVYASKRRAEVAPGVGKDTDMTIITDEGIRRLEQGQLDKLEEIYEQYQQPIQKQIQDKVKKLDLFEAGKS